MKTIIGLTAVLTALLTVGARAQSNADFVIESGILTKYNGQGGLVVVPDGVAAIGDRAFEGCAAVTDVTLPNSVTIIGVEAFKDCIALQRISLSNSLNGLGKGAFLRCAALRSIIVPNGVSAIDFYTFAYCTALEEATLGNISSLRQTAFLECRALQTLILYNPDPPAIDDTEPFNHIPTATCRLYVPQGAADAYRNNFGWSNFANILELDNNNQPTTNTIQPEWLTPIPEQTMTGFYIEPPLTVHKGNVILTQGIDYSVVYANNIDTGKASVTVSGMGDYEGVVTQYFAIAPIHDTVREIVEVHDTIIREYAKEVIVVVHDTVLRHDTVYKDTAYVDKYVYRIDTVVEKQWERVLDTVYVSRVEYEYLHDTVEIFIVVDPYTWVSVTVEEEAKTVSSQGHLLIQGLKAGQPFAIYTTAGTLYFRGEARLTGDYQLSNVPDGIYVLYHEGQWKKFRHGR